MATGILQTEDLGDKAALKQIQKEIKQLKKELIRKEKALAEAVAILVLRKKVTDYYGETGGEDSRRTMSGNSLFCGLMKLSAQMPGLLLPVGKYS